VPQYSRDDIAGITDLIESRINADNQGSGLDVVVNGVQVAVSTSLQDLLTRTLFAMIPGIQGNGVKNLHISLRRKS
jgi:hypothetical protein